MSKHGEALKDHVNDDNNITKVINSYRKSKQGYVVSRLNAVKHGILGKSAILPTESEKDYRDLVNQLAIDLAPEGFLESQFVEELAWILWRKRRLALAESAAIREKQARSEYDPYLPLPAEMVEYQKKMAAIEQVSANLPFNFDQIVRYEVHLDRKFQKTLTVLLALQDRRLREA